MVRQTEPVLPDHISKQTWDRLLLDTENHDQHEDIDSAHDNAMTKFVLRELIRMPSHEKIESDNATARDLGSLALEHTVVCDNDVITDVEGYLKSVADEEANQRDFSEFWRSADTVIDLLNETGDVSILDELPEKYRQQIISIFDMSSGADDTVPQMQKRRMVRFAAMGYAATSLGEDNWWPAEP